MIRASRLGLMALLASTACAPEADSRVEQLAARYELPEFLVGTCRWDLRQFLPVKDITGRFLMADEHMPDSFFPAEQMLPRGIPRDIFPVAYPKGKRRSFAARLLDNRANVHVSGTLALGAVTCPGNFSTEGFSGVLLLAEAR
jgi:hypothetical protein